MEVSGKIADAYHSYRNLSLDYILYVIDGHSEVWEKEGCAEGCLIGGAINLRVIWECIKRRRCAS